MLLNIKPTDLTKLHVFTYNLLYLLIIDTKAYNHDDTSRICISKKKRS